MIKLAMFILTPDFVEREGLPISLTFPHGPIDESIQIAKRLGYDGIEICAGDPDKIDGEAVADSLARHGIGIAAMNTGGMNYMLDISLINADPEREALAYRKLQTHIRLASRFGCQVQIGIARGNVIKGLPLPRFRDRLVEVFKRLCDDAAERGVTIVLEHTNRFEHSTINKIAEAVDVIDRVNKPNLGLLIDTYHGWLEEEDIYDAILRAKDYVRYFHLHDSDRGPAGGSNGEVDFDRVFDLLKRIGFTGWLADGLLTSVVPEANVLKSTAYLKRKIGDLESRAQSQPA